MVQTRSQYKAERERLLRKHLEDQRMESLKIRSMVSMLLFFSVCTLFYFFFINTSESLSKVSYHYDDFSIKHTYILNGTESVMDKFLDNFMKAKEEVEFYLVVEE